MYLLSHKEAKQWYNKLNQYKLELMIYVSKACKNTREGTYITALHCRINQNSIFFTPRILLASCCSILQCLCSGYSAVQLQCMICSATLSWPTHKSISHWQLVLLVDKQRKKNITSQAVSSSLLTHSFIMLRSHMAILRIKREKHPVDTLKSQNNKLSYQCALFILIVLPFFLLGVNYFFKTSLFWILMSFPDNKNIH